MWIYGCMCLSCPPIFTAFNLFCHYFTHSFSAYCSIAVFAGSRHSFYRMINMNRFFHSSLCLPFSLSFLCMLPPPLLSLLFIHPFSFHHLSPLVFLARVRSSTILSSLHSFIPPSLMLIYSPSTHVHLSLVRAAWNYLLLNGQQQLTPAQRCFAFIYFHSFCLCVCERVTERVQ